MVTLHYSFRFVMYIYAIPRTSIAWRALEVMSGARHSLHLLHKLIIFAADLSLHLIFSLLTEPVIYRIRFGVVEGLCCFYDTPRPV